MRRSFAKVFGSTISALLLSAVLLAPRSACPHATQLSSSRVEVRGNDVAAVLELNGRDMEIALETRILGPNGEVADAAVRRVVAALADYVLSRTKLSHSAGAACRGRVTDVRAKAEHLLVQVAWSCAPATGQLVYEVTLFQEIDPAARHMLTASGDVRKMALLSTIAPRAVLSDTRADLGGVLWHYLLAGVEHIAIGYDHVAFLVAMILWGRRLWPLVGVVTAFTLAHSLTLSLAVLGVVSPPQRLVEIAIALSIVYVAAENFFVRDLRRRWIVTFVFGLVHGFGFAGVLREYGIPQDALVPALAAFNIGVELGQIAIVLIALSTLHLIESRVRALQPAPSPRLVYPVSGVVLLLALYWAAERIILR
jgi:hydrogenase/urease accessory protein HupE